MKKRKTLDLISYSNDSEFFFRTGMRYVRKKLFGSALKYLSKAAEMEPFNADYQFNLACIFAELKQTEKSNSTLLGILRDIDPRLSECYFGIGCNYFDMGDFKKARKYFEKYVYFDPDGRFVGEIYDILYYLQIYDDVSLDSTKGGIVAKLVNEGKKLLECGSYKKACSKLEKAIEIDPELVSPRNDLSMAYFSIGEADRAISLAKCVLILEPENIFAHCNLLLFYIQAGKQEPGNKQLKILSDLKVNNKEELMKLISTYAFLKKHAKIVKILLNYLRDNEEYIFFHMLSTAFYNLKRYGDAENVWNSMIKLFPHYKAAIEHYIKINSDTKNGIIQHADMEYTDKFSGQSGEEYMSTVINRNFPDRSDKSKMKSIHWRKEWKAVIDCAIKNKEFIYRENYESELKGIWMNFISRVYPENLPMIRKRETWAAALEYIYCNLHLISVSKRDLAEKYNVSLSSIVSKLKDLGN